MVHDRNEEVQETREKVQARLRGTLGPDRNATFGNDRNRVRGDARVASHEAFVRIERVLEEPRGISISRSRAHEADQQR